MKSDIRLRAGFYKDAYFLTWNPKISGKQPFSAFPKKFPYFLSFQEKKASFWGGGTKIIISGWSMHYIKDEYTILSGLWAVIFTPHSSSGRAECECLSYVHRFQLIFHLFMPLSLIHI